jgi:hypothetical protein
LIVTGLEGTFAAAVVGPAGVATLVVPVAAGGTGETDDEPHADATIPTASSIPSRLVQELSLI